jgi:hypothetical protein
MGKLADIVSIAIYIVSEYYCKQLKGKIIVSYAVAG